MRKAVWCLLILCTAAFAQNAPDNAANNALGKRIRSMDLLGSNLRAPQPILLAGAMPPKICATPLLKATPPGTRDAMPVHKPRVDAERASRDELKQLPAPPCGDAIAAK